MTMMTKKMIDVDSDDNVDGDDDNDYDRKDD